MRHAVVESRQWGLPLASGIRAKLSNSKKPRRVEFFFNRCVRRRWGKQTAIGEARFCLLPYFSLSFFGSNFWWMLLSLGAVNIAFDPFLAFSVKDELFSRAFLTDECTDRWRFCIVTNFNAWVWQLGDKITLDSNNYQITFLQLVKEISFNILQFVIGVLFYYFALNA